MDDKLTIVGPEPSGDAPSVPARVNIEALLLMAKYDDGFRELLLSDRPRALDESGIVFSNAEKLLLATLSREKLAASIGVFSIRGVTRESLPSWKEAAAIILLVMTMLVGPSCQGSQETAAPAGIIPDRRPGACVEFRDADIDGFTNKWCDPDTFQVLSRGTAPKNEVNVEKRKEKSRYSAILIAKYRILEKFIGARIEAGGIVSGEYSSMMNAYRAEVKDIVLKGQVIAEKWNADQECSIIFQVSRPGLRRWAESGF